MGSLLQDLRYSLRTLAKSPSFAIVVILSLALGIGANTTIFTLGNAVLFRPLPVQDPERLVTVFTSYAGGVRYGQTSLPDYEDFRDRSDVFSGLSAYTWSPVGLKTGDRTEVVVGQAVSWNYFSVLGVRPFMGRGFLRVEDQTPDTHPVVVLSHRVWTSRLGADPDILGKTVRINDYPFTVVGIAPRGFNGSASILAADVWVPIMMAKRALAWVQLLGPGRRRDPFLTVVGRLKPGVGIEQAQAAMQALAASLEKEYPYYNRGKTVTLVKADQNRLVQGDTDEAAMGFALLMCVVLVVMVIACLNVANILFARGTGKRKEIAMRMALGASRGRIIRQLLTESVLLSLAAGVAGLLLSLWTFDLIAAWIRGTSAVPIEVDLRVDHQVLGFAVLLSLATAVISGMAPALMASRTDLLSTLRGQSMSLTRSRRLAQMQNGFVVAQVALSLILLISAGLFLRSLQKTLVVDPGFDAGGRLVIPLSLYYGQYEEVEGRQFYQQLVDRVRTLPGVREATFAAYLPLGDVHGHHDVWIEGYDPAPDESMLVKRNMVGPGYFATLGVRIVKGRAIDERDIEGAKPVAVVNEAMARRYWPGRDPIGGTVRVGRTVHEVVGIARDGKYGSLREKTIPYLCLPMAQHEFTKQAYLIVSTVAYPQSLFGPLREELKKLNPNLPAPNIVTMDEFVEEAAGRDEGPLGIVGICGLIGLVLATVGIYGVMSYSVSQRIQEIGIRMALGAGPNEVLTQVVRSGLRITLLGVGIGLFGAIGAARLWSAYLFGISPLDPMTFVAASVMVSLVAMVACYVPARRATKVDPLVVLRYE
jgi:predicted permease